MGALAKTANSEARAHVGVQRVESCCINAPSEKID